MRFLRAFGASVMASLLWAAGVSSSLGACGGAPEVVKSPEPAKVAWGNSEPATTPDAPSIPEETTSETPGAASTESGGGPIEVDLDALPPKEAPKGAESAAAEEEEEEPPSDTPPAAEPLRPLEKEMRAAVKSKEKKSSKPKKAAAKKSAPAEPAATYAGPNACKAARFSVARVGAACATGGRTGAKGVMKDAIGKALAAGTTLRCSDCHAEQRDYTLKPNAVAQLEKWLDG